jgi:3-keto-L-gulonate-6-phosphate decarboxylase
LDSAVLAACCLGIRIRVNVRNHAPYSQVGYGWAKSRRAKAHNKGIVVGLIGVAGGVKLSTIEGVQRAGADVAVVGGSIYGTDDPAVAAKELKAAII